MGKRINTSPSKVKLTHPNSKEVREFSLEHAQRMMDHQAKQKHISKAQMWTISEEETKFILKNGQIIVRPDTRNPD